MNIADSLPGRNGTDSLCGKHSLSDSDLLRAFVAGRDEGAFRALTERYAGMVYGIAMRRLEEAGVAQEVTSEVFTLLARKAPGLTRDGCLAAWLQRSAVLVTANAARRETRRRCAMKAYQDSLHSSTHSPLTSLPEAQEVPRETLAQLDESLARLPDRDRQLLLARLWVEVLFWPRASWRWLMPDHRLALPPMAQLPALRPRRRIQEKLLRENPPLKGSRRC